MEQKRIYLLDNEELLGALRRERMRTGKLVFGALSLVMIVLGFGVYLLSPVLGIDGETAELIALVFLSLGVFDYVILYFWDQIFEKMNK